MGTAVVRLLSVVAAAQSSCAPVEAPRYLDPRSSRDVSAVVTTPPSLRTERAGFQLEVAGCEVTMGRGLWTVVSPRPPRSVLAVQARHSSDLTERDPQCTLSS